MHKFKIIVLVILFMRPGARADGPPSPSRTPRVRVVDLDIGESAEVELCDGSNARVKLLAVIESRDSIRSAVRNAEAKVEVNGQATELTSAIYHLPASVAGVQIDCPITRGYMTNSDHDPWGLVKAARLRLWPAGSPWIEPGTFVYPARQRWFASATQMANEPTYVDGIEQPSRRKIYYHSGLDIGGAEGMVDVVAATDGLVVSVGNSTLPGYEGTPVNPRYDVAYVLDDRGWYYRSSHLQSFDPAIKAGTRVTLGQKIGLLGKEGGSGGWSHLHFEIVSRQPSGRWGTQEGYAFLWEAYLRQYKPPVIAVARPHIFAMAGEAITLDGSRSWSRSGKGLRYDWSFSDGTTASGPRFKRLYNTPGQFSEILKVSDAQGNIAYDFAIVEVIDRTNPEPVPPAIHAAYAPTFDLHPADAITFKARTFSTTGGQEIWYFGDGTPPVTTHSDGNVEIHALNGYAATVHRFAKPGDYLVRVERSDLKGRKATARLHVHIEAITRSAGSANHRQ
jgi:murein DD-endopeptidase MepM/ murein hydrolase activator NlpD